MSVPAARQPEVDLTIVRLIHDAFRRDFAALLAALRALPVGAKEPAQGLVRFYDHLVEQLHHHHAIEDEALVPLLAAKVERDPAAQAVLAKVAEQHRALDAVLTRVDDGMRRVRELGATGQALFSAFEDLIAHLDGHLADEERDAFPLVERLLTPTEFAQFEQATKKAMGLKGARLFFPWILETASEDDARHVLGELPAPLRLLYRKRWAPRYARDLALH